MRREMGINLKHYFFDGDSLWGTISIGLKPVLIVSDGNWEWADDMESAVDKDTADILKEQFINSENWVR